MKQYITRGRYCYLFTSLDFLKNFQFFGPTFAWENTVPYVCTKAYRATELCIGETVTHTTY